ncbi:hypothetical protein B296_00015256 [Ensete ventricosum]|uniref:Uncharacterized protein n=1 Tax=Ensete ventricosum TaxID=4639 RepID=A0A426ZIW8_ENSVE|nr:hypothetical protein B296_00015256 [Ensete ventricosum]
MTSRKRGRFSSTFKHFTISQIPRVDNSQADTLAKCALARTSRECLLEVARLHKPTIPTAEVTTTGISPGWMEEILRYKRDATSDFRSVATSVKDKTFSSSLARSSRASCSPTRIVLTIDLLFEVLTTLLKGLEFNPQPIKLEL